MSEETAANIIITCILLLIIALAAIGIKIHNSITFNDGKCVNCGGRYVYQQAVGHEYSTYYIYKCEQCGKMVEVNIAPVEEMK